VLVQRAGRAFDAYLAALGNRNFDEASGALDRLERSLDELAERFLRSSASDAGPDAGSDATVTP